MGGNRDLKKRSRLVLSVTIKKVRNNTSTKFIKNDHTAHATDAHAHTAPHTATRDHLASHCSSLANHAKLLISSSAISQILIDSTVCLIHSFTLSHTKGKIILHDWKSLITQRIAVLIEETILDICSTIIGIIDPKRSINTVIISRYKIITQSHLGTLYFSKKSTHGHKVAAKKRDIKNNITRDDMEYRNSHSNSMAKTARADLTTLQGLIETSTSMCFAFDSFQISGMAKVH